jgi:hypothetical protein
MQINFYNQTPSVQITLSMSEVMILQLLSTKLFTEDHFLDTAIPQFCLEKDADAVIEFACELSQRLQDLVSESIFVLPS